ncbi:AsnC family protein [Candidatus Saccharibacteria bacterium]|nr:AsnC family protein [Candidatus Saccharibacteria bacterium]
MRKAKALSPDMLRELYFVRGLSHRAIAREVGLSEPTVRARFHELDSFPESAAVGWLNTQNCHSMEVTKKRHI